MLRQKLVVKNEAKFLRTFTAVFAPGGVFPPTMPGELLPSCLVLYKVFSKAG